MEPWFVVFWIIFLGISLVSWLMYRKQKQEFEEQASSDQLNIGLQGKEGEVAKVYLYRMPNFVGMRAEHFIYCDGKPIAELDNGTWMICRVGAGKHVFSSSGAVTTVTAEVEGGKEYFIRTKISGLKGYMEMIPAEQAKAEMDSLK